MSITGPIAPSGSDVGPSMQAFKAACARAAHSPAALRAKRSAKGSNQFRADVQALTRKVEELAAAMASQGQAPGESATSVMPDRNGEPKRTSGKGQVTWASWPLRTRRLRNTPGLT